MEEILQGLITAAIRDAFSSNCRQDVRADRELAHTGLRDMANKFKESFDTARRENKINNVGDIVYVYQDHRRHSKLSPKYKGPYEIQEVFCVIVFTYKIKYSTYKCTYSWKINYL